MSIIQTTAAQRRLQLTYGLEGPPPAPTLAEEIVPVTIVDDLTPGSGSSGGQGGEPGAGIPLVDPADPFTVRQYERALGVPDPGGALHGVAAFVNPIGSTVVAMLTQLAGTCNVDGTIVPFFASSTVLAVGAGDVGYLRDMRLIRQGSDSLVAPVSQCGWIATSVAAGFSQARQGIKLAALAETNGPDKTRFMGYVTRPNSHITFTFTIPSETFSIYIIWTERTALQTELGLP